LTPEALMARANMACSSARALLELGDMVGASSRAYYAMFDAARAALLLSGAPVEPGIGRTHSGLIGAFGNYLVKDGLVSKDMGRLLNRAHEIRLIADYKGDPIDPGETKELVEQAENFVRYIQKEFVPGSSDDASCVLAP
jgi:uncharacterized protein (UPF0332 family)